MREIKIYSSGTTESLNTSYTTGITTSDKSDFFKNGICPYDGQECLEKYRKHFGINDCTPKLPDNYKINEYPNEYNDYYSKINDWSKGIGINDCTPKLPDDYKLNKYPNEYNDFYSRIND